MLTSWQRIAEWIQACVHQCLHYHHANAALARLRNSELTVSDCVSVLKHTSLVVHNGLSPFPGIETQDNICLKVQRVWESQHPLKVDGQLCMVLLVLGKCCLLSFFLLNIWESINLTGPCWRPCCFCPGSWLLNYWSRLHRIFCLLTAIALEKQVLYVSFWCWQMANHSFSTITFQWDPVHDTKMILEVEPPFGELGQSSCLCSADS